MSTQKIYEAVIHTCRQRLPAGGQHLDIGAGQGELIAQLGKAMAVRSSACDFHVERFPDRDIPLARVDLCREPLPYADSGFDLVTCSEVVEHVENFRHVLREAYRVLKEGGLLVVTTPNVLNANSRVRYLCSGFPNLFGPLPVRNGQRYTTGGHITPIPYFYLAHALLDAGFEAVELGTDKVQRTSLFWLTLLFPFIFAGWVRFLARERGMFRTITAENRPLVAAHLSWPLLVGRTLVVSAFKRATGPGP